MSSNAQANAIVEPMGRAPAIDTGFPAEFQWCVSLGAVSADAWGELGGRIRLHDYAVQSCETVYQSVRASMAAAGEEDVRRLNAVRQAFTAGFMGRIQQHLYTGAGHSTKSDCTVH
ncbi:MULTISPECIES: hypothetical protein [Paraburkholderia]|uniref:hypothetical protein n=1 Tax=Paraburkholderia TaxID=1822464 RepID=UPI0032187DF6